MRLVLLLLLSPLISFSQRMGVIKCPLYDINTYVLITDNKKKAKVFVNHILGDVSEESDFDNLAMTFYDEGIGLVVWFPEMKLTFDNIGIINHEVSHIVLNVLGRIDTPLSEDTSEVYAYLTEFYNKNIYKIVYGKQKYYILPTN